MPVDIVLGQLDGLSQNGLAQVGLLLLFIELCQYTGRLELDIVERVDRLAELPLQTQNTHHSHRLLILTYTQYAYIYIHNRSLSLSSLLSLSLSLSLSLTLNSPALGHEKRLSAPWPNAGLCIQFATYRSLQVCAGQISVLGVREKNVAQLQVRSGLHPWRRFEIEDRLEALDAGLDAGRARGAKVLGEA